MRETKDIIDRINEEAKKKADNIIAKAEQQSEQTLAEARTQADEIWDSARKRAEQDATDEHKRMISNAMLESKKKLLEAKRGLIDKVFDEAVKKVREINDEKYENFLKKLITKLAEGEKASLFVAYNDQDRLSASFLEELNDEIAKAGKKTKIKYSDVDHDINEGFVLSVGKYQIDASMKNIAIKQKEVLEADVVKILFG